MAQQSELNDLAKQKAQAQRDAQAQREAQINHAREYEAEKRENEAKNRFLRELQERQERRKSKQFSESFAQSAKMAESMPDLSQISTQNLEYEKWKARHGLLAGRSMKKGLQKLQNATLC